MAPTAEDADDANPVSIIAHEAGSGTLPILVICPWLTSSSDFKNRAKPFSRKRCAEALQAWKFHGMS
nr:hypothetical protein [Polymorphobacter megasporae]